MTKRCQLPDLCECGHERGWHTPDGVCGHCPPGADCCACLRFRAVVICECGRKPSAARAWKLMLDALARRQAA